MVFQFTRLCLNGGGIRGLLQMGSLQYLESIHEKPLWQVFHNGMHGVSIGAIITSMLAFGFTTGEILKSLDSIMTITSTIAPVRLENLLKVPSQKGIDDGAQLKRSLTRLFALVGLDFEKLHIRDALCPLRIYASDITRLKIVAFHPDVPLWDALRASTSIPFVFIPHTYKGRVFVDGGLMVDSIMKCLAESHRADSLHIYCSRDKGIADPRTLSFSEYSAYVMNANYTREHVEWERKYPRNICVIRNNTIQALDFEKAKTQKDVLLQQGAETMKTFLSSQELR